MKPNFESPSSQDGNVAVTNAMQRELMLRFLNGEEGQDKKLEWVEKHSAHFRTFITEHPELISQWVDDQEGVISALEEELGKDDEGTMH